MPPPAPEPAPPRRHHPWEPPEAEFPGIVPIDTLLLGRTDQVAVAVTGLSAFSAGIEIFLTARIRHKIDDEFPEITDSLLGILYPHYQRPVPSMSVVQFVLSREQVKMTTGHTIERGARLNKRPIAGAIQLVLPGSFDVSIWHWGEAESARYSNAGAESYRLPSILIGVTAIAELGMLLRHGSACGQIVDRASSGQPVALPL